MDQIYSFDGKTPSIHADAYIHPTACLIGDVRVERQCFIGPHATLRGDHGPILLGAMSNVQDNCVLHSLPGGSLIVGSLAQVGHSAVLHGCRVLDGSLIGIHAIVLDGAVVGANSIVGANSLVVAGARLVEGALYIGSPVRLVRALSLTAITALRQSAIAYAETAGQYASCLVRMERQQCIARPPEPEPDFASACFAEEPAPTELLAV